MVVRKTSNSSPVIRRIPSNQILPDEKSKAPVNLDLSSLIEHNDLPAAFNRDEILFHASIPEKNPGMIRNMFIDKYIQTQGSVIYLINDPVVEIKI